MRRLQALLIGAGLAVAPATLANPTPDKSPDTTLESFTVTSRARLGVMVIQLTPELRKFFGADEDRGVLIGHVEPKSAAQAAGLQVGDVLTEVKGAPVDEAFDVVEALAPLKQGEKVAMQVMRNGKSMTLTATMQDSPGRQTIGTPRNLPKWFRDFMTPWNWPTDEPAKPDKSTRT